MDKNKLADKLIEKIRQDFFDTLDRVYPLESYHNKHLPNRGTLAVHLMAVVDRASRAGFDAAESIANAKIQELWQSTEPQSVESVSLKRLRDKITELEQINKSITDQRIRFANKITELEQQLNKAEEVIKELDLDMVGNAMALARQYLKSRGE